MAELKLGLQLFTVYPALRDDFEGGLKPFIDMGYKNMELAAFDPGEQFEGLPKLAWKTMSGKDLRALADRNNIHFVSVSVPLPSTMAELKDTAFDWDREAAFNAELGSMGPVYSMMFWKNKDEVLRFAEYMNEAAKSCKKAGVDLFYHNHFQEFQQFDGKYAMDIVLENTDPDVVKLELDTFWAQRGGVDPVTYLKKLGKRCTLVHQKDLSATCTNVDVLSPIQNEEINMEKFMAAVQDHEFIEVGEGVMDIPGIIRTLREIGAAEYIIIEQDHSKLAPQDSARLSYKNMTKLMA